MSRYPKGAYKKDTILSNAKTLFYQKGIAATTLKEIAAMDDDPVSLVHYYFRKKDDIVREIYYDFFGNIDLFVYSNIPATDTHVLMAHILTQRIYYDIIFSDVRNKRVYDESLGPASNARLIHPYIEHVYRKIIEEFDIVLSEDQFQAYISMDFGARREIIDKYATGQIKLEIQELTEDLARTFPLMIGLSQEKTIEILAETKYWFEKLDHSNLKFLI